jgi:hypothetical protein
MKIDNKSSANRVDERPSSEVSAAEQQTVTYVVELLNNEAQPLTTLQTQRLMLARRLAVSQLARQQAEAFNHSGNVLQRLGHHLGEYWEQHRNISAALIVLAMLLTFFAGQQFQADRSLEASDAFLLASDLPPEAYADKGFDTWLEANNN